MNQIEKAINFAAQAHEGQYRKSTKIPYITHPFAVGMLLQQVKCSEEVIVAGILHDTVEDTSVTFDELVENFGEKVANLVKAASEHDKSLPWKERKLHTIESLRSASIEEIQVTTADKLHNLRSIHTDLDVQGEAVWSRFNRGKKAQHWYYSSIVKVLLPRKREFKLIGQLEREVKTVFGSLEWISDKEIDALFSCVYGLHDASEERLAAYDLVELAEQITSEADQLYQNADDSLMTKLEELTLRGIEFQNNSDGPLILASFCLVLQKTMGWTEEELFKHFKRNKKRV